MIRQWITLRVDVLDTVLIDGHEMRYRTNESRPGRKRRNGTRRLPLLDLSSCKHGRWDISNMS